MVTIKCGFSGGSGVALLPANAGDTGDTGSILGLGRSPGEGNSNSLQYSCLGKPRGQRSLVGSMQSIGVTRVEHNLIIKNNYDNQVE